MQRTSKVHKYFIRITFEHQKIEDLSTHDKRLFTKLTTLTVQLKNIAKIIFLKSYAGGNVKAKRSQQIVPSHPQGKSC